MIQVFKNFPRCMFSLEIGLHSHFNTWGSSRVLQRIKSCLILNSVNPHMCPDHDPKSLSPHCSTPLTYCRGSNRGFLWSLWNPVETPYDRYGEGNGGPLVSTFHFLLDSCLNHHSRGKVAPLSVFPLKLQYDWLEQHGSRSAAGLHG